MYKICIIFIFLFINMTSDVLGNSYSVDVNNDGIMETVAQQKIHFSGGSSAFYKLAVVKNGIDLMPIKQEIIDSNFKYIDREMCFTDRGGYWIKKSTSVKSFPCIIIFDLPKNDGRCKAYFYRFDNRLGRMALIKFDISDKIFSRNLCGEECRDKIIAEFDRSSKFSKAYNIVKMFLENVKSQNWNSAANDFDSQSRGLFYAGDTLKNIIKYKIYEEISDLIVYSWNGKYLVSHESDVSDDQIDFMCRNEKWGFVFRVKNMKIESILVANFKGVLPWNPD